MNDIAFDTQKYGEYGSSGSKPIETFDPTCNNSKMQGALLDTSWLQGTMSGHVPDVGVKEFNPPRISRRIPT